MKENDFLYLKTTIISLFSLTSTADKFFSHFMMTHMTMKKKKKRKVIHVRGEPLLAIIITFVLLLKSKASLKGVESRLVLTIHLLKSKRNTHTHTHTLSLSFSPWLLSLSLLMCQFVFLIYSSARDD